MESHHHKLVLSLRANPYTQDISPKNQKLFSKSIFHSVDGPKKANRHSQWRNV